MQVVLEVENLIKDYRGTRAVDGISFAVHQGEIVGLLGPNGAGKTTTINIILSVLKATQGKVRVAGYDIQDDRSKALLKTNFAAVYAQMPVNMTVAQNLYIFALLYTIPNPKEKVRAIIKEFNLEAFQHTKCGLLSSGEQARLSLAKAMLNNPTLLLLDEPTSSLDPNTANIMRAKIRSYVASNSMGVLWTSHNMHEVEEICDRVYFLSHGKVLLEGDPKKLPELHGKRNLEELFITVAREPLSLELE